MRLAFDVCIATPKRQDLKPPRPTSFTLESFAMATVVSLGAGDSGGALARQLAAIDLVARIVIVDDLATVAAGKALDVMQSAPVDGYHTVMAGTADVSAVVGAAVIIVADTAASSSPEWKDEAGLA